MIVLFGIVWYCYVLLYCAYCNNSCKTNQYCMVLVNIVWFCYLQKIADNIQQNQTTLITILIQFCSVLLHLLYVCPAVPAPAAHAPALVPALLCH